MPLPRPIEPVAGAAELPASVDVVVIGGGIVGASTALVLAERGISVAVCEKGEIGGEQSSRNWGLCRQTRRHPAEMPLMIKTIEIWKKLKERVGAETGFVQKGLIFTCDTEADIAELDSTLKTARQFGLDTRLMGSTETAEFLPGLTRKLAGAVYTASDGSAEPSHAAPAIARGAAAKGAIMLTQCAVRGLEMSAGRVSGVVTEKGTIRCQSAVLATGAWSRLFLGNMGLTLPALHIHTSIQATAPMSGPPDRVVYGSDFCFRQRLDGGWNLGQLRQTAPVVPDTFRFLPQYANILRTYHGGFAVTFGREFFRALTEQKHWGVDEVTPFERTRVLAPAPHTHILKRTKAKLDQVAPWFRDAEIRYQWAGVIDILPDELPVISHVDGIPGLVVATGFSGHGFGIGPGAGQLTADVVTGATPIVDPRPFTFARFRQPRQSAATGKEEQHGNRQGSVAGAQ